MTAFRALLATDADLLAEPVVLKSYLAPGAQPSGRGQSTDVFVQERPNGTRFAVKVPNTTSYDAANWVADPAITRLNALADTMADVVNLVGATGLANPTWAAYKPSATAVIVRLTASIQPPVFDGPFGPDIQKTGWPFGGAPDTFGAVFTPNSSMGLDASTEAATFRCAFLSSDDTLKAITSLPDAGASLALGEMAAGGIWGSSGLRWGDKVDFGMRAVELLPEDVAGSCADAFSY
jgi:hypothetical protein